jgi:hypothetical protein
VTPLERNRAAWLGSLIGIAELTGKTVAEAAKRAGRPPYAKPGDGEEEVIAKMAAGYDANPPPANDNGDDTDDEEDDGGEDGGA